MRQHPPQPAALRTRHAQQAVVHRTHHFADDREARLGDEVEVGGDRPHERVLDGQDAQVGAPLEHRPGNVAELAMRLRHGTGVQQQECFFRVGAQLALKCYPLVYHRLRVTDPSSCR